MHSKMDVTKILGFSEILKGEFGEVTMAPCRTCALAVFASCRCGANMAHIRQSRPDYGLGFQAQALKISSAVPSCLDAVIERGGGDRGALSHVHLH